MVDREKLQLRSTFSKYLGEDVMEEALRFPEKLNHGEKREMSVLFSDIRGFTTLSDRLVPEKLAAFMKDYLSPMTQIVFDEKGTLDKYIGDAVMAFWNAPLDQNDHALRPVRAGWAMLRKLDELKLRWRAENFPEFDIGVGINTGPMIVGNIGSDVRVDYTVMGDAVNLASRLEGTNKDYETRIIIRFDWVANETTATGYLAGSSFSVADLAVASHLATCVDPPHVDMQRPQPAPQKMNDWLARWRSHPGAAWVMRMYAKHRPQPLAT